MRIAIHHRTKYHYDKPFNHAVQSLRLRPPSGQSQSVVSWDIAVPGFSEAAQYIDAFGNRVDLVTPSGSIDSLEIIAEGLVETHQTGGITGFTNEIARPGVFLRDTAITTSNLQIIDFARTRQKTRILDTLHSLLSGIFEDVVYDTGATHSATTAAEAFKAKRGVCQDHAHIFISAARQLGIPARYVTGYLFVETDDRAVAHHAWSEAFTEDLGWIGFDAANGVCPTENYVRLAVGLDAVSAAPIKGTMRGSGVERLAVEVVVRQAQQ